jgi:hypothetical protein
LHILKGGEFRVLLQHSMNTFDNIQVHYLRQ